MGVVNRDRRSFIAGLGGAVAVAAVAPASLGKGLERERPDQSGQDRMQEDLKTASGGYGMGLKGLKWVGICTADLNSTAAFYTDILGLSIKSRGAFPGDKAECHYIELKFPNGDIIELFDENLSERELFSKPVMGFLVENVAEARREMEAKGVTFLRPTVQGGDTSWAYFLTPDGQVCQIMDGQTASE